MNDEPLKEADWGVYGPTSARATSAWPLITVVTNQPIDRKT